MAKAIDITGHTYGRLTVIRRNGVAPGTGAAAWLCLCVCGKETTVNGYFLRKLITTSCGCAQRAASIKSNVKRGATIFGRRGVRGSNIDLDIHIERKMAREDEDDEAQS